jgi:hypothetical protein
MTKGIAGYLQSLIDMTSPDAIQNNSSCTERPTPDNIVNSSNDEVPLSEDLSLELETLASKAKIPTNLNLPVTRSKPQKENEKKYQHKRPRRGSEEVHYRINCPKPVQQV